MPLSLAMAFAPEPFKIFLSAQVVQKNIYVSARTLSSFVPDTEISEMMYDTLHAVYWVPHR